MYFKRADTLLKEHPMSRRPDEDEVLLRILRLQDVFWGVKIFCRIRDSVTVR